MLSMQLAVAVLMATALAASGCGESSKSSTSTSAATQTVSSLAQTTAATQTQSTSAAGSLTPAELITKADLICARLDAIRGANVIKSKQALVLAVSEITSNERRALAEMAELTPPAALASSWNNMLAGYRTLAADMDKVKQDIAENKVQGVNSLLTTGTQDQRQTAAIAKGAGFNDCGKAL